MKAAPFSIRIIPFALAVSLLGCTGGSPAPVAPASVSPDPGASAVPSLEPGLAFQDEFDGTALDESRWKVFQQSGLAIVKDGRLELLNAGRAKNFPYLVTRNIVVPQTGAFYVDLSYEVLALAENGLNFCLDYLPPEGPGEVGLTPPFLQATARSGDLQIRATTERDVTTIDVKDGFRPGKAHRLRLEFDGKATYHLLFNDQVLKVFNGKRRPQKFWIGTYPVQDFKEAYWPRLAIDRLAIGELSEPRPVADATPSPTAEATAAQPAG